MATVRRAEYDEKAGPAPRPWWRGGWAVAGAVAALLATFAGLAWVGAREASATYDEPLHGVATYMLNRHGDFRVNPEHPVLWQRWAGLLLPADALRVDRSRQGFATVFARPADRWQWAVDTLYETPGNDADGFLGRLRVMMVALGVGLGAVVAWWGWQLGGGAAAVVAAALFCFDPNFLAHAPMVTNDVALSLVTAGLMLAVWRAGRRLTAWNAAAVILLGAAAPATKFSGLPVAAFAVALLAGRAVVGRAPWHCLGREVRGRVGRLRVAGWLTVGMAVAAWGLIWASYGFRFAPAPDGRGSWYMHPVLNRLAYNTILARAPSVEPTPAQVDAFTPGLLPRAIEGAERIRLLPQTWLFGLLSTYADAQVRESFLMGEYSPTGFVSYFPLAFAFKTPVGAQAAVFGAAALGTGFAVAARRRRRRTKSDEARAGWEWWWAGACLAAPVAAYVGMAMGSNLHIGVRHILPVYPLLYVGAGWALSRAVRRWGRPAAVAAGAAVAAVAVETALAAPDFLSFFNAPSGGARGGIQLLGDSNLDWGQDLPALAAWQRAHPHRRLYLSYFGTARPEYYGIRHLPVEETASTLRRGPARPEDVPDEPGVIAISATHLQGIYLPEPARARFKALLGTRPIAVLGGSIYVYDLAR